MWIGAACLTQIRPFAAMQRPTNLGRLFIWGGPVGPFARGAANGAFDSRVEHSQRSPLYPRWNVMRRLSPTWPRYYA
jgi:hypothetical protein